VAKKPMKDRVLITFALPGELVKRIDEHRYKNHIPNRSEAMRQLMDEALRARGDLN
jgi:metal-responsive CopG/Arc/MetJ family transcriptional regulator